MRSSLIRMLAGLAVIVVGALACRDPSIDPKMPPDSPLPKKPDRPDDRPESPSMPKLTTDGGATR